jgi:hypothetical protein
MLRLLAIVAGVALESQFFSISGITGITSVALEWPVQIRDCGRMTGNEMETLG